MAASFKCILEKIKLIESIIYILKVLNSLPYMFIACKVTILIFSNLGFRNHNWIIKELSSLNSLRLLTRRRNPLQVSSRKLACTKYSRLKLICQNLSMLDHVHFLIHYTIHKILVDLVPLKNIFTKRYPLKLFKNLGKQKDCVNVSAAQWWTIRQIGRPLSRKLLLLYCFHAASIYSTYAQPELVLW